MELGEGINGYKGTEYANEESFFLAKDYLKEK